MPVPAEFKQRKQRERLDRLTALAVHGYWEAKACFDEVFCQPFPLVMANSILKIVMREYALNLEANNIRLKEGQIEPHALYMRTFFMEKLRGLKFLENCIQTPISLPDGRLWFKAEDMRPGRVELQLPDNELQIIPAIPKGGLV